LECCYRYPERSADVRPAEKAGRLLVNDLAREPGRWESSDSGNGGLCNWRTGRCGSSRRQDGSGRNSGCDKGHAEVRECSSAATATHELVRGFDQYELGITGSRWGSVTAHTRRAEEIRMYVTRRSAKRTSGCMSGCGMGADGAFVVDTGDSSNYAPNMVSAPYSGSPSGIDNSTGFTAGGANANGTNGWLTQLVKGLTTKTSGTTAGKAAPAGAAPAGTSWLAQQNNTTLAIGGTSLFALLLALTR
jgi:hypothetical protein